MSDQAADLGFTFDTRAFEAGISRVQRGMTGFGTSAKDVARGVTRGMTNIIAKIGLAAGALKLVKGAIDNIPEIGQAFGIAKDTILKNLLWPLRKEILPLLQRMLDWVRDNRAQFVKWGQALAAVFRAVVNGIKQLVNFAQSATSAIFEFANRIFGTNIRNINDVFNLISFKLATIIEFIKAMIGPLQEILSPIIDTVGNILGGAIEGLGQALAGIMPWVDDIARGFGEAFNNMLGFIDNIISAVAESGAIQRFFDSVGRLFTRLVEIGAKIWEILEPLGTFIGGVLAGALDGLAVILNGVADVLEKIIDFFNGDKFRQGLDRVGEWFRGVGEGARDFFFPNRGQNEATEPQDISLPQTTTNNRVSSNTSVDVGGVQVILPDGTAETAEAAGRSFVDGLREEYNTDFRRRGA
jgi:phage-related protein